PGIFRAVVWTEERRLQERTSTTGHLAPRRPAGALSVAGTEEAGRARPPRAFRRRAAVAAGRALRLAGRRGDGRRERSLCHAPACGRHRRADLAPGRGDRLGHRTRDFALVSAPFLIVVR